MMGAKISAKQRVFPTDKLSELFTFRLITLSSVNGERMAAGGTAADSLTEVRLHAANHGRNRAEVAGM
jgi:hypothetical protein